VAEKTLICGGTGFIGKNLARCLTPGTVRLLVHDRCPEWTRDVDYGFEIVRGDLLERQNIIEALKDVSRVVNLVGSYSRDLYHINIKSAYNLLEACRERVVERLVFMSSETIYGECGPRPALETDRPRPITEYAITKYLAECLHKSYADTYRIPVTVLRMSNVYGPEKKTGVIFNFLQALWEGRPLAIDNDGRQRRDFVYIDDAARGIVQALNYHAKQDFEVFNITATESVSLLELVDMLEKIHRRKTGIQYFANRMDDIRCLHSSCEKARSLLGFQPEYSLERGIGIMSKQIEQDVEESGKRK